MIEVDPLHNYLAGFRIMKILHERTDIKLFTNREVSQVTVTDGLPSHGNGHFKFILSQTSRWALTFHLGPGLWTVESNYQVFSNLAHWQDA